MNTNLTDNNYERFQEGLFTAFFTMEKAGLKREQMFKIFKIWEENNIMGNKDYTNLEENYIKFYEEYEEVFNNLKSK